MLKKFIPVISYTIGVLLIPTVWFSLHYYIGVGERFLPSPVRVLGAAFDLEPTIFEHTLWTAGRFLLGSLLGIMVGIVSGLMLFRSHIIYNTFSPAIQALRAIPPIATVPFFLLWFGFSEIGKFLLISIGIGLNLAVATHQILHNMPEKYAVFFYSFQANPKHYVLQYALPTVLEKILPTIRFSLATALGLVIVAELLGSQIGLGYLIQTSRATFSLHVIFLATIFLGILMSVTDYMITRAWKQITYWSNTNIIN